MRPSQKSLTGSVLSRDVARSLVGRLRLMARGAGFLLLFFFGASAGLRASAQTNAAGPVDTNAGPRFNIQRYLVKYNTGVFTNVPPPVLTNFTGTNVSQAQVVEAGSQVLLDFQTNDYPQANVSIALDQITNGTVQMYVYEGAYAQVLVSGQVFRNVGTVEADAARQKAQELALATNHLNLVGYEVVGNDLLSDETLESIFSKHVGTNVPLASVFDAQKELVLEYRNRGYDTVNVVRPPQRITNGILRLEVVEGTLAAINVVSNRYYSSNNVMRALPSLQTNMIPNDKIFGAELDRANANQDRQIYPEIDPGPEPGTSILNLRVNDRLPLHAKTELNNQASPGTPELRLNSSAVYNNLWQQNHALGVQYSFSPEVFKTGTEWGWYDRPLVANFSGFYRMPLGNPESIADIIESEPGTFGYNEATRKFNIPPPSGSPELNIYASRSTIDTGLEASPQMTIFDDPGVRQVFSQNFQEDLTINNQAGFRISEPTPASDTWRGVFSGGPDYKSYDLSTTKTNVFQFTEITVNINGTPNPPIISTVTSPVPLTHRHFEYLPLTLRYDGNWQNPVGTAGFGLGLTQNVWHSGSPANLQAITGSTRSSGYWTTLNPNISQDINFDTNWTLTLRADGQWASEPLISNEQFGAGGVASVRGYQEGQVFGDTGWHVSAEQKTPGHVVGVIDGDQPLIVRASVFMDYAETYLLDPQGRDARVPLWGVGFGTVASIGTGWEARFLFSVPLLSAGGQEADQPFFNFSLTAQF
jgi:hemolysin activation/secretion protein